MTNNWDANFWRARRVMVFVLGVLILALFSKIARVGCVNIIAIGNIHNQRWDDTLATLTPLSACFDQASVIESSNIALIRQLGLYVQNQGNPQVTVSFWRVAVERIPGDSFLPVYLGLTEIQSGDLDSAVVTLAKVPNAHRLLDNLGKQKLEQKDYNHALAIYLVATRLASDSASIWKGLGRAYRSREDMRNAALAYQKSVVLDPNDPDSFYGLGEALYWLGDYRASVDAYKSAILLEPRRSHYHFGLGQVYLQLSEFQAAADALGKAVLLTPGQDNKWFLYSYGWALENLGRFCEAARQYRRAVVIDPTFQPPADRLRALERTGFLAGCE